MPVSFKLTKTQYDSLSAELKSQYKAEGDGFVLDVQGAFILDQDPSALINAKEHEKSRRQDAEKKLKDFQDAEQKKLDDAKRVAEEETRKKIADEGDLPKLQEQFQSQIDELKRGFEGQLAERDAEVAKQKQRADTAKLEGVANAMASEICVDGVAHLLAPQISLRLGLDDNGNVVVKNKAGQIDPLLTVESLKKETVDNPALAAIIAGTKGSGASGPTSGGTPVELAGKKWNDLSSEQKVALKRETPDEYDRLLSDHKKAQ